MKLQTGHTYLSNGGEKFTLTGVTFGGTFTDGYHQWEYDGSFLSCDEDGNPWYDLVEDITDD